MSLRLEMTQVARLASKCLGEATPLVRDFLWGQQNPDGGFKDRSGRSDLYYTVFGIDSLLALQAEVDWDSLERYVVPFGDGGSLDFVHLCCLARTWGALAAQHRIAGTPPSARVALLRRIEGFRAGDGGYHPEPGARWGSAYGAFLALGAHEDLGSRVPDPERVLDSLAALETPDGAWTTERRAGIVVTTGATNATAAAVAVIRHLGGRPRGAAASWLLAQAHPQGGFRAAPQTPAPDLLSTATALHALSGFGVPLEPVREGCLDFIDTLWTNTGSFHGHWADDFLDTEYTFYGLLALGHLAAG
jgi:prenyltransferase beta subunit